MENIIFNVVSLLLTSLIAWKAKGQYDKRVKKVKSDILEIDSYNELYEKMQIQFVKLRNEILEYQKMIHKERQTNIELKNEINSLKIEVQTLSASVKESKESRDLYKQALDRKKN